MMVKAANLVKRGRVGSRKTRLICLFFSYHFVIFFVVKVVAVCHFASGNKADLSFLHVLLSVLRSLELDFVVRLDNEFILVVCVNKTIAVPIQIHSLALKREVLIRPRRNCQSLSLLARPICVRYGLRCKI